MASRCVVPVVAVAALGCSSSATTTSDEPRPIDETPESAFVAIVSPDGDPKYVCSGVVVAPRVVVTAAHCFVGGNYDKTGWTFEVVLGPDARDEKAIHVALEPHVHPDYPASDADIAIGVASEDLRIAPRPWARVAPSAAIIGANARYAGFGAHTTAAKGTRHVEAARIVRLDPGHLVMEADPSPCHGDSGGPLLAVVDGVETVLGVGHTAQSDGTDEGCTTGADYTRTDSFASFIASF